MERHLACGPEQPPAPAPVAAVERLGASPGDPAWYQIVVCTSDMPDAGTSSEVWLSLAGEAGASARVALPSAPGDFARGREDVFRLALAGVGAPQRLTVGLTARGEAPGWHLEQVEVTEEATGGCRGGLRAEVRWL